MLNQFSWQQFLIASLVIAIIWYSVFILIYHRKQFTNFFTRKKEQQQPQKLANDWDDEFEEDVAVGSNLMGEKKLPEGVSVESTKMFGFAPKERTFQIDIPDNNNQKLGLIPDLIEELKSLFNILSEGNGTKEDFLSLFDLIKSKYTDLSQIENHEALNDFILENVPFEFSESELKNLWS